MSGATGLFNVLFLICAVWPCRGSARSPDDDCSPLSKLWLNPVALPPLSGPWVRIVVHGGKLFWVWAPGETEIRDSLAIYTTGHGGEGGRKTTTSEVGGRTCRAAPRGCKSGG